MHLYCWPHNTTHLFSEGQVEKIVYALFADAKNAVTTGARCPREMLALARDPEAFLEYVNDGVTARKTLTSLASRSSRR